VLVTESDADPILCKLQCNLSKQLLNPFKPPDARKTHLKTQGSSLGREGGSDSQRAAAIGSTWRQQHRADWRRQQHRADWRRQQQHEFQAPGEATTRSAAQLARRRGPCPGEGAQV